LERRRQLAAVNGKLVGEEADASDALVVCERRGEFHNIALYELDGLRASAPSDARSVLFGLRRREGGGERLPVRHDERGWLLSPRADDDHLADVLALLYQTLDELRRDVLAVRELEQLLLAVCDEEVAALVEASNVARLEPSVLGEDRRGLVRMVVVAAHHVGPAHEYLALLVCPHLDAGERQADRADAVVFGPVRRDDAGLRHAVALQYRHARAEECVRERGRQRRSARHEEAQPAPDALAPLRED